MKLEKIYEVGQFEVYWNDEGCYEVRPQAPSWATVTVNYTGGDSEELAKDIANLLFHRESLEQFSE